MELTQLLAAFLASALGAGTFLRLFSEKVLTASLERVVKKEMLLVEADLEFRQRQLEEFYGPIYASLKLNAKIYEIWLKPGQPLEAVNQDVIDLFEQNNTEIITLLKTKAHLIEGSEFPPEFVQFMTSATIWGMYCTRPGEPWIPDEVKAKLKNELAWPQTFETHIYTKTEELKQKLDKLLRKHRAH